MKTTKFLEEKIGGNLHDTGFGNNFLDMAPKAQYIIEWQIVLNKNVSIILRNRML